LLSKKQESRGIPGGWTGFRLAAAIVFDYARGMGSTISTGPEDADGERVEWLAESKRRLLEVWDNDQDDVFNELLGP